MFSSFGDFLTSAASTATQALVSKAIGNDKKSTTKETETAASIPKEFDEIMRSMLSPNASGQVSEEELFAANVGEKISSIKGKDILEKYKTILNEERTLATASDGFVKQEEATINALKRMVADGSLTTSEGDSIYTQAFKTSQLDSDTSSLFDSKGGVNDPTTAMALLSEAIKKVQESADSVKELKSESLMSLQLASATGAGFNAASALLSDTSSLFSNSNLETEVITPNGTFVDGSKGFLFKPVTNNEGSLAVLGDVSWTGNINSVVLKDSLGQILEIGKQKLYGVSETGQEKWNFSKQGSAYPKNISVEISFLNGTTKTYTIADPSKRYD